MVAIVTDVHYRMSLALIRDLAQAGVEVITCEQSRCRGSGTSPALGALSRYASRHVWLEGPEALRDLCREIGLARDCLPALLPVGAATLAIIAENRGDFDPLCGLCIPTAEQLDLLNSKPRLAALAAGLGVPLPESMAPGEDLDQFLDRQGLPCVVKPVCGEKLGLTAAARYAVAATREEAREAWERFSRLAGEPPVVQGYLPGRALGCSVLARSGEVLAAVCHRRIREYPVSGGPSSCCQCVEREDIRTYAARLAAELTGVRLRGLMCIPPAASRSGGNLPYFQKLCRLAVDITREMLDNVMDMDVLSMGMSGDWPDAVAAGSTCIRVGSALFGPRPPVSNRKD